jgi:hypothetical protein
MHNGMVPSFLDDGKSSRGLITPRLQLHTKNCRNMIDIDNSHVIIGYPCTFYYLIDKFKINHIYKPGYQIIGINEEEYKEDNGEKE